MELKTRIEQLLSEILSEKHECEITLHFERKEDQTKRRKEKCERPYITEPRTDSVQLR